MQLWISPITQCLWQEWVGTESIQFRKLPGTNSHQGTSQIQWYCEGIQTEMSSWDESINRGINYARQHRWALINIDEWLNMDSMTHENKWLYNQHKGTMDAIQSEVQRNPIPIRVQSKAQTELSWRSNLIEHLIIMIHSCNSWRVRFSESVSYAHLQR